MLYKILNFSSVMTTIILIVGIFSLIFFSDELNNLAENNVLLYSFVTVFFILSSLAMMNVQRNSREDKVLTKEDAIRSVGLLIALMLFMAFFNGMLW
ncbi:hypothetical protein [Geomicrobium sp. JCM 19037]|uniref:hypothetical protein n=1 Tax=Geomicrobium sp. JCM 19037 TaxID=1460634 RepID=UPI0005AA5305|nr:hypothetical protein [Geomicrobium sp. JCM 19037]